MSTRKPRKTPPVAVEVDAPPPIAVGDSVTMLWGGGHVTGTVTEIRADQKAVVDRGEGKTPIVRSLAFLERASTAAPLGDATGTLGDLP